MKSLFFTFLFLLLGAGVAPHYAGAQPSVGGFCDEPSDCTGQNEYCNTTDNICSLTDQGVRDVLSGPGQGSSNGIINVELVESFSRKIIGLINQVLVPLLMAIAFIVFLSGVFKYFIYGGANDKERQTGRMFILYGILGFVVVFSLWGLVWAGINFFGLGGQRAPGYPLL